MRMLVLPSQQWVDSIMADPDDSDCTAGPPCPLPGEHMPHAKNGEVIEVGDVVKTPDGVGTVLEVYDGCGTCNLAIAVVNVMQLHMVGGPIGANGLVFGLGHEKVLLSPLVQYVTAAECEIVQRNIRPGFMAQV